MAAKFLFCLPLRLGVILFTLFQFLAAGAASAFLWFIIWYLSNGKHGNDPCTSSATTPLLDRPFTNP